MNGNPKTVHQARHPEHDDNGDGSMSERAKSGARSVMQSPIVRVWVLPAIVALIFSVGAAAALLALRRARRIR